jgi:hypothetical protein
MAKKVNKGLTEFLGNPTPPNVACRQAELNAFNRAVDIVVDSIRNGANAQIAINNMLSNDEFKKAVGTLAVRLAPQVFEKLNNK